MPQQGFDVNAARQAGYSDDEILSHLTATRNFDVSGAVASGYSKADVIDYLSGSPAQAADTGQQTNDVGNTVIVPKQGESFLDTMKRAATQGKQTTQGQMNAELQTAPKKLLETLTAAPAIGALGAAGIAGAGEAGAATPGVAKTAGPVIGQTAKAVGSWTAAHPLATAMGYHIARELGIPLPKILDVMSKFQGGQP
jgi:hypothetical protein